MNADQLRLRIKRVRARFDFGEKDTAPGKLDLTVAGHGGPGDPQEFHIAAAVVFLARLSRRAATPRYVSRMSAIPTHASATLTIPLIVKNAVLTRDRSSGLTSQCS